MSYQLNKTDGTLLVELLDGTVDNVSTDLTLIGRNYSGFGEIVNENYIKLLENFSNAIQPQNAITGQLWYDTSEARLKVFNGTEFRTSGGPIISGQQPALVAGDLWIDTLSKKLFFFDGNELLLAGPAYSAQQGTSGFIIDSILDVQSRSRTVCKLFIGGQLTAVVSNIEFTPAPGEEISGINGNILKGFNLIDDANFKFNGVATSSNGLITDAGVVKNANQFLPSDANGTTVGTLTIQNSGGLTIGLSQNNVQKVVADTFVIENQLRDHDLKLRVRSSSFESLIVDAVTISAENARVGIFNANPQRTLDVAGDARISGNLIVEGETTTFSTNTLEIKDKNIELAKNDSGILGDDIVVDNGGITLSSTDGSKTLNWRLSTDAWTSSENFDLSDGRSYHINGTEVLSSTALGAGIVSANGLNQIGTLQSLNVDDLNIDGTTITTTNNGLNITSADTIIITNNKKISGVADPTEDLDVTNKRYVDTEINSEPVVFSLDITALDNNDIAAIIGTMFSPSQKEENTQALIHTTTVVGATVTGIDIDSVANKEFVNVDKAGTENEAVLRDIAFDTASGTVNVSIARGLKRFIVQGNNWVFDTDLPVGI